MNESLRSGTLTFLFTDLEDSTGLWEQFPEAMRPALARHDALLKTVVENHRGRIVKTTGDGLHAVFESPMDAVAAALAGQQTLIATPWPDETGPLKVRMGLHTGESQFRDGDYYGSDVNLAVRITSLGYGGQVLLSEATATLTKKTLPEDCSLADLGTHRLKGVASPEEVYQLCHPDLAPEYPPLKSLSTFKHNLPRQLSSFIGREKDLADVKRLLADTQLLTLLGPGGTGKTRLMLQAAEKFIEDYPDGVWLVELAPLADPDLIGERVAATLGVQEQPGRAILDTLTDYLRRKETLLLLDNVEHIVRASAALAENLLKHCPKLKILVTGREALFISGEITLQIPSLSLPEASQNIEDIESLERYEAIQLFLDRARAVRPDFVLLPENAAPLIEIVQRLDGIPLALELAAARMRMLTIEKIAERLNDRFRLLTGGRRTALPRQQTLEALIDWSWKLLDENERILLQRLSVFSGGWSLEAAEEICGFEPLDAMDVFDNLDQLINKSLVVVDYLPDGEPRYRMLESIRQFARDHLFEAGEGGTLRDRHAIFFVAFTDEAAEHMNAPEMMVWVGRLRRDLDNLRAVMTWTLDERPELSLRLTGILRHQQGFWMSPGEAHGWLSDAINQTRLSFEKGTSGIQPKIFIRALVGLANAKGLLGDVSGVNEIITEAISLARKHGEYRLLAHATALSFLPNIYQLSPRMLSAADEAIRIGRENNYQIELSMNLVSLGGGFLLSGDPVKGEAYITEGLQIVSELGNPRGLARVLDIQGHLVNLKGDPSGAREYFLQAIENFEAIGDQPRLNMTRSAVAHGLRRQGRVEEAKLWYRETILAWQEQGHLSAVAHQLECFAFIAIAQDKYEHAARLLGTANKTRIQLNAVSENPQEIAELEQAMSKLAEVMGEADRDRVMVEGEKVSLDEAVLLALRE